MQGFKKRRDKKGRRSQTKRGKQEKIRKRIGRG